MRSKMEVRISMAYSKKYYETYAKLVLEQILSPSLGQLTLSDRPDLITEDRRLGIEVTRATNPEKEKEWALIERYWGTGYTGIELQKKVDAAQKKPLMGLLQPLDPEDESSPAIYTPSKGFFDTHRFIDEILGCMKAKEKKAMKYDSVDELWLYIFSPTNLLDEHDYVEIMDRFQNTCEPFYKLIVNALTKLFIIERDKPLTIISISDAQCSAIDKQAKMP